MRFDAIYINKMFPPNCDTFVTVCSCSSYNQGCEITDYEMHCSKCGQKDLKLIQSLYKIRWKGEGSKAQLRSSTAQTISCPGAEMFLASIPTNGLQINRRHVESKLSTINMSSGVLICWYCWHLPLHSQHGATLQGGRFVLSRSNPLEIGLKLHYQVKKQLFSAQNGGRK